MSLAFVQKHTQMPAAQSDSIKCSSCQVKVSPFERNSHYRSDWHRYNVKRRCVSLEPLSHSVFQSKVNSILQNGLAVNSNEHISKRKSKLNRNKKMKQSYNTLVNNRQWQWQQSASVNQFLHNNHTTYSLNRNLLHFKCTLCQKSFKTHQQCLSHLKTKKHAQKFKTQPQNNPGINVNVAELNYNVNNNPCIKITKAIRKSPPPTTMTAPTKKMNSNLANNSDATTSTTVGELGVNESNTESEHSYRLLNVDECLFCTETFAAMDLCIEHMMTAHGFFVPFSRRLLSLKGLLLEAGKLIGVHHQCVWCYRVFKSLKAVQSHMRHRTHCKLQLEYGPDLIFQEMDDEHSNSNSNISSDDNNNNNNNSNNNAEEEEAIPIPIPNPTQTQTQTQIRYKAVANTEEASLFMQYYMSLEEYKHRRETQPEMDGGGGGGERTEWEAFDFDFDIDMDLDLAVAHTSTHNHLREKTGDTKKRFVTDINSLDELVLNDGSIIGHRSNLIAYKHQTQLSKYNNHNTRPANEMQIVAQLNNPNRRFELEAMAKLKEKEMFEKSGIKTQNKYHKKTDDTYIGVQARNHLQSKAHFVGDHNKHTHIT